MALPVSNISKQDLRKAFELRVRKRNVMLYAFYHSYFLSAYSARYIAEKISADLGLTIGVKVIERIRTHQLRMAQLAKGLTFQNSAPQPPPSTPAVSTQLPTTGFTFSDPNQLDTPNEHTNLTFL